MPPCLRLSLTSSKFLFIIMLVYGAGFCLWISNSIFYLICEGLLKSDASTALEASKILKEVIKHHIDEKFLLTIEKEQDDKVSCSDEKRAIKSICDDFENLFSCKDSIPNEHILAVICVLFLRLGKWMLVLLA